jgi:hypothetical protein
MPRRWALLTVTLATIATTAAVASLPASRRSQVLGGIRPGPIGPSSTSPRAPAVAPPVSTTRPAPTAAPPSTVDGATPAGDPLRTREPDAAGGSEDAAAGPLPPVGPSAAADPGPTSSSAGPPTMSVVPNTTATPSAPAAQANPGNLESPDDVSAAYPYRATSAGVAANATWVGTPLLSLSIVCSGQEQSASGPSGLSLSLRGSGTCVVTLAEPPSVAATVSYTLSIGPIDS